MLNDLRYPLERILSQKRFMEKSIDVIKSFLEQFQESAFSFCRVLLVSGKEFPFHPKMGHIDDGVLENRRNVAENFVTMTHLPVERLVADFFTNNQDLKSIWHNCYMNLKGN